MHPGAESTREKIHEIRVTSDEPLDTKSAGIAVLGIVWFESEMV